jgi:hypothetical protein
LFVRRHEVVGGSGEREKEETIVFGRLEGKGKLEETAFGPPSRPAGRRCHPERPIERSPDVLDEDRISTSKEASSSRKKKTGGSTEATVRIAAPKKAAGADAGSRVEMGSSGGAGRRKEC